MLLLPLMLSIATSDFSLPVELNLWSEGRTIAETGAIVGPDTNADSPAVDAGE